MAVLKSEAKFTEPFVDKREVIVMLSVQGGQATASATKLDYDAVHALEQTIVDLTFVADTPQTESQNSNKNSNVISVYDGVSEAVRCAMCSNPNKSDRGCDGACSYDEKLYERIMKAIAESVADTPQTETSKTIPLNEWLSFKEYVLEMDGEGGPRIFRIIPMSEYKLQNQELHTDCGWGKPITVSHSKDKED